MSEFDMRRAAPPAGRSVTRRAAVAWLLILTTFAPAAFAGAQRTAVAAKPTTPPPGPAPAAATAAAPPSLDQIEYRAFRYFWDESYPTTGLTKDRAVNVGASDTYTVASIAATGYALAALPVAVERGWVSRPAAYNRALTTLRFVHDRLPSERGFYYHFVDWRSGERVWNCELSSIDSALLVLGALTCGQYFKGSEAQTLADDLYARMDWPWMRQAGADPDSDHPPTTLSMGRRPESADGWLTARWDSYSEASFLYLMAIGAPGDRALPASTWSDWPVRRATQEGYSVLGEPGPIFMAQMCPGYFDLRGLTDSRGFDWWQNFANVHKAHIAYCSRSEPKCRTYQGGVWGISASDRPDGYGANAPVDGQCDGTIVPSAILTGILFVPDEVQRALKTLWSLPERNRFWGRYGFSDAINVDKGWYDGDVIGIDLGMMLLALEDRRSGLTWKLVRAHPMYARAMTAAGMREGVAGYPPRPALATPGGNRAIDATATGSDTQQPRLDTRQASP